MNGAALNCVYLVVCWIDRWPSQSLDAPHVVAGIGRGVAASVPEHSAAFKLDPARLVYSLRWKHNAHPPDFEMVLVQGEPVGWVNTANLTLLSELRRRAPEAIDWAAMGDVVPVLDAFEVARASQTARHH